MRTADNVGHGSSGARVARGAAGEAVSDDGKGDSKLDDDPLLRTIFNGYAFAIDYREERGHAYMLERPA
jgi:nitrite reductase (cytochrome c-552)